MPLPAAAPVSVMVDEPLVQMLVVAAVAVPVAGVPEQLRGVTVPFNVKSSSLLVPLPPWEPPLHTNCTLTDPVRLLTAVSADPVILIVPVFVELLAVLPVPTVVPAITSVHVAYPVPLCAVQKLKEVIAIL